MYIVLAHKCMYKYKAAPQMEKIVHPWEWVVHNGLLVAAQPLLCIVQSVERKDTKEVSKAGLVLCGLSLSVWGIYLLQPCIYTAVSRWHEHCKAHAQALRLSPVGRGSSAMQNNGEITNWHRGEVDIVQCLGKSVNIRQTTASAARRAARWPRGVCSGGASWLGTAWSSAC